MIEVENISKSYGNTLAVDKISFSVERGEVLGFLGPNGAGKTTVMKILTCFFPPDSGKASLFGHDIEEHPHEIKRLIGYLPENNPLYDDMGVYDYLNFIADIRGIDKSRKQKRIAEMVEICGLNKEIFKDIYELSKGNRQRVGLAQALMHSPDILLLDEPTSGLDPNQIVEIRNLIKEIGREKTVLLCTHILSEVEAACNRTIIINEGRVVAQGTPEEIAQKAMGNLVVYTTLKGDPGDISEALSGIKGVISVKHLRTRENDRHQFILSINRNEDICEEIFMLARDKGYVLSQLHTESSFEKAFSKLTRGGIRNE